MPIFQLKFQLKYDTSPLLAPTWTVTSQNPYEKQYFSYFFLGGEADVFVQGNCLLHNCTGKNSEKISRKICRFLFSPKLRKNVRFEQTISHYEQIVFNFRENDRFFSKFSHYFPQCGNGRLTSR